MRQISFSFMKDYKKSWGGALLDGKRKSQRPISTKNPLHLVLKSVEKNIFNPGNRSLERLIRFQAQKFGIKIYDLALNWSHIHLLIRVRDRQDYVRFIRSLTAILTLKICKTRPDIKKIFILRPFTRIISWGRDFKNALCYQTLNQLEALNLISRPKKKLIKKKTIKEGGGSVTERIKRNG